MKACTQCGKCCTTPEMVAFPATPEDVERWRDEERDDILAHAFVIGRAADLWFTKSGAEVRRCPFVRKVRNQNKYTCTIYDTRPEVCRDYPGYVGHMKSIGCEMLDDGDTDEDVKRFMGR